MIFHIWLCNCSPVLLDNYQSYLLSVQIIRAVQGQTFLLEVQFYTTETNILIQSEIFENPFYFLFFTDCIYTEWYPFTPWLHGVFKIEYFRFHTIYIKYIWFVILTSRGKFVQKKKKKLIAWPLKKRWKGFLFLFH